MVAAYVVSKEGEGVVVDVVDMINIIVIKLTFNE